MSYFLDQDDLFHQDPQVKEETSFNFFEMTQIGSRQLVNSFFKQKLDLRDPWAKIVITLDCNRCFLYKQYIA